ncbi:putative Fructokinase [Nitrospina gracilis 3/211]|uniref:Putative Fructokinase n=1 Tax=Nitrospina gracilis (strain 3/211) TaxID=1266370 RepID=M1Z301_NITG3|nr:MULTISPECIES: PfkB family carbohydrate kinase [Nitrospina]MCF8721989.1 fructokinase [Nitrospina sp. Nb-3]CCQ92115.1 putative Fructokinase [Nitrospina gracilis 3/211]
MRVHRPYGPVLVMGEVLFDKFESGKRLGGAPFNYAFHLHKMGIPVHFISRVGDDAEGREILEFARNHGFPTEGIQIDPHHPTGEVTVNSDSSNGHRFEILPDRAYDFIEVDVYLQKRFRDDIPFTYFGTLIQRNGKSRETLHEIQKKLGWKSTFLLDINLRAPFYDRDVIENSLKNCDILKANRHELQEIKRLLDIDKTVAELPRFLAERFKLGLVCVTNGSKASVIYETGNREPFYCTPDDSMEFVDSVGAGDGFSSMLSLGYMASWPLQTVLERSCVFATGLCGLEGALPGDDKLYQPYRLVR